MTKDTFWQARDRPAKSTVPHRTGIFAKRTRLLGRGLEAILNLRECSALAALAEDFHPSIRAGASVDGQLMGFSVGASSLVMGLRMMGTDEDAHSDDEERAASKLAELGFTPEDQPKTFEALATDPKIT